MAPKRGTRVRINDPKDQSSSPSPLQTNTQIIARKFHVFQQKSINICIKFNLSLLIFLVIIVGLGVVLVFLGKALFNSTFYVSGSWQKIEVSGQLVCCVRRNASGECAPISYALISLYDYNYLLPNELMNMTVADKNGRFKMRGSIQTFTVIEPFIQIKHICAISKKYKNEMRNPLNYKLWELLVRQSWFAIPPSSVNTGIHRFSTLNLEEEGWRDTHFFHYLNQRT